MSIYIIGDTHNCIDIAKLSLRNFPESRKFTEKDYVVICGDFGFPLLSSDVLPESIKSPDRDVRSGRKTYLYWMKWLSQKPYTILFVDGNHDNPRYWNSLPSEQWCGGFVHRSPDAPNVIHLQRGEYYTIAGKTFWTFGGAELQEPAYYYQQYNHWQQVLPSKEECVNGIKNLGKHDCCVDYIITHTMPTSLIAKMGFDPSFHDTVSDYLEIIHQHTKYQHWFCGHFHTDQQDAESRLSIVYQTPLKIETFR